MKPIFKIITDLNNISIMKKNRHRDLKSLIFYKKLKSIKFIKESNLRLNFYNDKVFSIHVYYLINNERFEISYNIEKIYIEDIEHPIYIYKYLYSKMDEYLNYISVSEICEQEINLFIKQNNINMIFSVSSILY